MSLQDWQKNGWLKAQPATPQYVADLLALAERDLKDCRAKGLSDDWKFNIAYNAALQGSTAALAASGYAVPKGESHHFRVIQSLAFTIGMQQKEIDLLDLYRKKRSMNIYDAAGVITTAEAGQIVLIATDLLAQVRRWLKTRHPGLAP